MTSSSPVVARLIPLRRGAAEGLSDADIARALVRGDKDATYQAWNRFASTVRANLRRLLGPGLDEDDLCQDVFLRFFRSVRGLREPEAVRAFVFGVCLRVARKELRRRWLRRWLRLTDDGALPEPAHPDVGDAAREAREAVGRYYALLDEMGGEARSLYVARYVEGMELTKVAELHGMSVSTAQRRLARAAKRIDAMVLRDPMLAEIARGAIAAGHEHETNDEDDREQPEQEMQR